jgi:hypothetical protein
MEVAQQEEVRSKYALICRGLLALRNTLEGVLLTKSTGEPLFDDSDDGCQKLLLLVEKASHLATQHEVEALIAEYGPDARPALT